MKSNPVTVTALVKAKPGKVAALKKELLKVIAPTRKEDGCISYDLHQDVDDSTVFVFHETWASREHLDAHLATPHLQALVAVADKLTAEPVRIIVAAKVA